MAYENNVMVELMVPRNPDVAERIHGFYQEVGWETRNASDDEFFTYVNPSVQHGPVPVLGYFQHEKSRVTKQFKNFETSHLSKYGEGLRLPKLQDLVEVCLVVPTEEDVKTIYEQGGSLLKEHAHVRLRQHADSLEFRFADPFNYSLRVTADPGWEIQKPTTPTEVRESDTILQKQQIVTPFETNRGDVLVVTRENVVAFAKSVHKKGYFANHIYDSLWRKVNRDGRFTPFWQYDEKQVTIGLKADRLAELVELIQIHRINISANFGDMSKQFLLDLHAAIFSRED